MTVKRSWLRRIGCTLPGLGLAAWLGWNGWHAFAQDRGVPPTTLRSYLNKTTITLPIVIDDRHRAQLRNILLYVKEGETFPWRLCDKAAPTQKSFTYRAPAEGEYWFSIVSVDTNGRMMPADVTKEAPALIVVLDTQAPQIEVQPLDNAPEGQLVRCDWRDLHMDMSKSRFYYQTADMVWRSTDAQPGKANTFCIPAQANWTGNVRAVAVDLAGNTATREMNLARAAASAPTSVEVSPVIAPSVPKQITVMPTEQSTQLTSTASSNMVEPEGPPKSVVPTPVVPTPVAPTPVVSTPVAPTPIVPTQMAQAPMAAPVTPTPAAPKPEAQTPTPAAARLPEKTEIALLPPPRFTDSIVHVDALPIASPPPGREAPNKTMPTEVTSQKIAAPAPQLFDPSVAARSLPIVNPPEVKPASYTPDQASIQRQYSNTGHLFLDYRIEAMGASGVGKVEVWYTRDLGKSWQKLCEDTDRQSPAEINLPGDGLYGVSLVISNGRGFGATAPNPGDAPDSWVEVDSTRPHVELVQVRAGGSEDNGALHIAWSARDKNLPNDAVELQYAGSREGPWHQVARGLKNEGIYRWIPPAEVGPQVFLRVTVRDQANNVGAAESSQPVQLDDASRPHGRVLSISTSPPRANPLP